MLDADADGAYICPVWGGGGRRGGGKKELVAAYTRYDGREFSRVRCVYHIIAHIYSEPRRETCAQMLFFLGEVFFFLYKFLKKELWGLSANRKIVPVLDK